MVEIADYLHGTFDAGDTADIQRVMRHTLAHPDAQADPQMQAHALAAFSWERSAQNLMKAIRRDLA